jgi:4-amino-4-deoxy-L-arabinose transferase-like glycosyltransferase
VCIFFIALNKFSQKWIKKNELQFKKLLFWNAFTIRTIVVTFLYFFYQFLYDQPFEFKAADSLFYHDWGLKLSDSILNGDLNIWDKMKYLNFSDRGYPFFLGIIYTVGLQSIIFPRIVNAILGSFTCVLIYNISRRNFDERTARLAGVLTMLLPNLIYYTGLHLKETLMVFIIVAFIERADFLIRSNKLSVKNIIIISVFGVSLCLFRVVLGGAAFSSLFIALAFTSGRISRWRKRIFAAIGIALLVFTFLSDKIILEVEKYWSQKESNLESQMQFFASREGANEFSEYGNAFIFAPIILFAPFPTLVNVEGQDNQMMLSGVYYTKNIYIFFVIISLIAIIKRGMIRHYLLILFFILFYLAILANSGFALSERFHLPLLPFYAILAAFGITQMNKKNKRYFIPYLIIISIIIVGWNWFKLAGRGMI